MGAGWERSYLEPEGVCGVGDLCKSYLPLEVQVWTWR